MIINQVKIDYVCMGCGKSRMVTVHGVHEKIERIYDRHIKNIDNSQCETCKESKLTVAAVTLKLNKDIRNRWRITWHCRSCDRNWVQYRYLTQRDINAKDFVKTAQRKTQCTCKSPDHTHYISDRKIVNY